MKGTKLMNVIGNAKRMTSAKAPALLTGLALAGLCVTVYKAYKAGPKIDKVLQEKREDLKDTDPEDKAAKRQVIKEAVKEIVPIAAPVVVMGAVTAGCILGSNKISSMRLAVMSAGYEVARGSLDDVNKKMQEILGEKKTREVRDAIVKEKIDCDGPVDEKTVIVTGNGDVLCKDLYSGRYFRSNADKINRAIAEVSVQVRDEMEVGLNDLYSAIGIPSIPMGDDLGFVAEDAIRGTLPITISAQLSEDGQPCLCLDYDVRVLRNYANLM